MREHEVSCCDLRNRPVEFDGRFSQVTADPSKVERVHAWTLLETGVAKNHPWSDAERQRRLPDANSRVALAL